MAGSTDAVDRLLSSAPRYPKRIVCLTEETTETLYRLGLEDRIVGISGFTYRPPSARRDKPVICTFLEAKYDEIEALEPDLVIGFSDLQADIGRELAKRGVPVCIFNQRSVAQILQMIRVTGTLVGEHGRAEELAAELEASLRRTAVSARGLPRRPRVFFEEWHDPLICGIRWVSELIEVAGGDDVCADRRHEQAATGRTVHSDAVAALDPEVVVASWCGKMARRDVIAGRPGWTEVSAVREDQLYEIKSEYILQPGPAALTDGLAQLTAIIAAAAHGEPLADVKRSGLRHAESLARGVPQPKEGADHG